MSVWVDWLQLGISFVSLARIFLLCYYLQMVAGYGVIWMLEYSSPVGLSKMISSLIYKVTWRFSVKPLFAYGVLAFRASFQQGS